MNTNRKKILITLFSVFMMFSIILGSVPLPALAVIYQPGETLNPACAPTDPNCGVVPSLTTNNTNSVNFGPTATTTGGTAELRFLELAANGSNYAGLKAPDALAANVLYVLPNVDGASGQVLSTDGSGALSWVTATSSQWITSGSAIYYNTGNVGIGTNAPTANLSFGATTATINNAATNGALTLSSNGTGKITLVPGTSGLVQIGNSPTQSVVIGGGAFQTITSPQIISMGQILPGAPIIREGLRFLEPAFINGVSVAGNNYVGFQAPGVDLATTTVWSLPVGDGTNGQMLATDGAGALAWATSTPSQWTTSGSNIYYNTGNIGIGASAPTAKLTVSATGTTSPLSVNGEMNVSAFPGWSYRRPVIVNASSALTNYQTSITVDTAALVTAGKMQSDGRDIRITASDGTTLQNYWIETGTMNTATTRIWFGAASLVSGANTFYLYYGNASATAASNGDNTFIFFDDFNGSSVDAAKWIVDDSTGLSVSGGSLIATNNNAKLRSQWSYAGTPVVQETQGIITTDFTVPHNVTYGSFWASGSDGISFIRYGSAFMPESEDGYFVSENIVPAGNTSSVPLNTEFLSRNSVISGTQVAAQMINYSTGATVNNATYTNTVSIGERILLIRSPNDVAINATGSMSIRFARARQYTATEPTASVGSEVATPTVLTPSTFLTVNSSGNVLPGANAAYDLGSATNRWKDLFLSGATLYIGDQTLSNQSGSLTWSGTSIAAAPSATSTSELKLSELSGNGVNFTGFKAPDALAANVLYTLPSADGTSGQSLITNGSGGLSWVNPTVASVSKTSTVHHSVGTALAITTAHNNAEIHAESTGGFTIDGAAFTTDTFGATIVNTGGISVNLTPLNFAGAFLRDGTADGGFTTLTIGQDEVYSLTVTNNAGAKFLNVVKLGGGTANVFAQNGNSFGALATLGTTDSNGLSFITNNAEAMRILAGGNIGIGTNTPTAKLEISPTNTTGVTWATKTAPTIGYKSVAFGNGTYVAVADTNLVATSPDSITWTQQSIPTGSIWRDVTYANGLFVAVGSVSGVGTVMTSSDGITWTSRTPAANNNWESIAYGNNLFIAVSSTGTGNRVMTSPDGITWTSRTSASDDSWRGVTYNNNLFVAVSILGATYSVMTSPDGITWTGRTATNAGWNSITYGGGLFVAAGEISPYIMTSPDGITWTDRTAAAANFWRGVTYGNGIFVAVAGSGTGNRVMTSPDGITWTSRTTPEDNNWNGITFGNNLFVAVADSGTNRIMTSSGALPTAIIANGGISVAGSVVPTLNIAYDLGSATNRWKDLYLSGATLHLGTQALSNDNGTLKWNGSTVGGASQWTTATNNIYYSTGNVAIGTSTPSASAKLLISGAVVAATAGTPENAGLVTTGSPTIDTTTVPGETIIRWTGTGTFTPPTGVASVETLVVAGGGGGGVSIGGGGGAGGYRYVASQAVVAGTSYPITVGAGGAGAPNWSTKGSNGTGSSFTTITTVGGGAGSGQSVSGGGVLGGSGGGGARNNNAGGAGTSGEGNSGGSGSDAGGAYGGGGGGGAGAVGGNGSGTAGGNGGVGLSSSITGVATFYAGGGGGGRNTGTLGLGGNGGGGNAADTAAGVNGTANTGGGGGANSSGAAAGGAGGSGVVIVRFTTVPAVAGGTASDNALLRVIDTGTVASSTLAFFEGISGQGCIIAGSTGLSCSSDKNLKKDIEATEGVLGNVLTLKPVTYNWRTAEELGADGFDPYAVAEGVIGDNVGFIAQDVEKIFPGLVRLDPNGNRTLAYDKFAPLIVAALQEQYGGMMGVNIASVAKIDPTLAELFASTTTLATLNDDGYEYTNIITNPVGYVSERVEAGIKVARTLVAERMVAVEASFKRIFANELCLTDLSGQLVCVTGDALKNIGGAVQQNQESGISNQESVSINSSPTISETAPVEESVPVSEISVATEPTATESSESISATESEASVIDEVTIEPEPTTEPEPIITSDQQPEPTVEPESVVNSEPASAEEPVSAPVEEQVLLADSSASAVAAGQADAVESVVTQNDAE